MEKEKFLQMIKKLSEERSEYVTDPYDVQSMYEEIASDNNSLTPRDVAAIGGVESEHGKYQSPLGGGSARGTFQLMPKTIKYLKERLEDKGIPEEINPLREEARLTKELMKQHENELKNTLGKDVAPTVKDLYIKHNLGAGMGKKLLRAPADAPIENILPEKVINSNPSIYKGKTKKSAIEEIQKRLDKKGEEFNFEDRSLLGFLKD